jgi:putative ABC transport system permease protein
VARPPSASLAFSFRLAWRESRAAWRRFAGLVVCVALGVSAVVGVSGFAASLGGTLAREGRALMGGDLEIRAARPLESDAEHAVAALAARGASVVRVRELAAMARAAAGERALLVEIKAVDDGYPLYGRLETDPARPAGAPLGASEALVQPALLDRLGLRRGDEVAIGETRFRVAGVVTKEPDRPAGLVSLGPRVLVSQAGLDRTGLVQLGSRVRYRTLIRLVATPGTREADRAIEAERVRLAGVIADPGVRVAAFDDAQPGLRRLFGQVTTYLGLVGLTSLLVGGIGVAASVHTYVRSRLAAAAILRALGASTGVVFRAYLVQTLTLGVLASAIGIAAGAGVARLLGPLLASLLPVEVDPRISVATAVQGLLVGVLTTLLCALWPLLRIRAVPALAVLRLPSIGAALDLETVGTRAVSGDGRARRLVGRLSPSALAIGAALSGLAVWQAGSLTVGALYVAAGLATLTVLAVAALGARRLAARLPVRRSLAWRHGLANLHRPGSQAVGVVVALGVAVTLLTAVALLERALGRQLDLESRRDAPTFFFVDVQPDQTEAFARTVAAVDGARTPTLLPVVRARLAAIDGRPVVRRQWEGRKDDWRVTREYVLTFADEAPAGTVMTRGRWWTEEEAARRPRISVEDEAARALGVDVGGTLTFDVQGVRVEAEVQNLRHVDWQNLSVNFFVIFSAGALQGAPRTYLGTARVRRESETAVQEAVARSFPNVSAVPVRDVLERVQTVLDQIAVAIRAVGLFVVGAGLVVMTGTLAASRARRLTESVLLRTLGATRALVLRAVAVEYGGLGLVAGVAGAALGSALTALVLGLLLDLPWRLDPPILVAAAVSATGLAVAVGFLGTFRLLGRKPLPVLRRE